MLYFKYLILIKINITYTTEYVMKCAQLYKFNLNNYLLIFDIFQ